MSLFTILNSDIVFIKPQTTLPFQNVYICKKELSLKIKNIYFLYIFYGLFDHFSKIWNQFILPTYNIFNNNPTGCDKNQDARIKF